MRVAISGGIGSGKSQVTKILRALGACVVVADEVNAGLLCDKEYIDLIENTFPTVVHNKVINKKELADLVYNDESKRALLMSIAHPRIFERMFSAYPEEKVVFYEIPLLSKTDVSFDIVWFVYSDRTLRLRRIAERDNVSKERAARVMSLQREEDLLREKADVVIDNSGTIDDLCQTVKALYYSILEQLS